MKLDLRKIPVIARQRVKNMDYPALYQQARTALQKCAEIDEIKDVRDKHDALAHYAKQAKDEALQHYAERIKLRALERIGEILLEFPEGKKRTNAYRSQGIAAQTASQAIAIATVPKRVRDTMIDKSKVPPKVSRFRDYHANQGPVGFYEHTQREVSRDFSVESRAKMLIEYVQCMVTDISYICALHRTNSFTPEELGRALTPDQVESFRNAYAELDEFLDSVDRAIPEVDPTTRKAI